jgi:hypothetical protein
VFGICKTWVKSPAMKNNKKTNEDVEIFKLLAKTG